ncbi:WecB/TagA/CpsF family glycosyltransferase [Saccharicrinis sp. FJH2]|uniref:WecB/TagA/CpsF family glycosyltransferase n=1 Tax=Saccharicrinis sp. FJH65 TaxID=3344659 RepID=UPI0035F2DF76
MKTITTLNFKVFSDNLEYISINDKSKDCRVINTISPNSYGISTKDKEFKNALKETDFLVLDGVYFAFASLLLNGKNIKKNQGPDVFYHFMERLNAEHKKAFFLGSSEKTLEMIKTNAKFSHPNILIDYFSPPFKDEFSELDNQTMISKINMFEPDILFIGMTCPKQEKWAIKHKKLINAGLTICVGNVFDWFAGTQKAIKPIWFKLRLAWLIRILIRPEIFKRNIGNQLLFFWHVILIFLKLKKYD